MNDAFDNAAADRSAALRRALLALQVCPACRKDLLCGPDLSDAARCAHCGEDVTDRQKTDAIRDGAARNR